MMDIYETLGITDQVPDVRVKELYEEKMREFKGQEDSEESRKKCEELRLAYNHLVRKHQNWAKTVDDAKRCLANAQIAIEKLQSLNQTNTAEYLSIRSSALFSLIQTEKYYLKNFKKYCSKRGFILRESNEEDFLYFFEVQVEKEFRNYIANHDSKRGSLENRFNYTITRRFADALRYIGELNSPDDKPHPRKEEFNFYELVIDVSKQLTKMHLHGYQKEGAVGSGEIQYYRMLFTETVSLVAKKSKSDPLAYISHERDIFDTMEVPFLDFYTRNICRNIYAIVSSPLKEYREIGIDKNGEIRLEGKLEGKVYHRYFMHLGGTVTEASVGALLSRYRKKYYKILKELKDLWYESFGSYANTSQVVRRNDGTYVQVNLE